MTTGQETPWVVAAEGVVVVVVVVAWMMIYIIYWRGWWIKTTRSVRMLLATHTEATARIAWWLHAVVEALGRRLLR